MQCKKTQKKIMGKKRKRNLISLQTLLLFKSSSRKWEGKGGLGQRDINSSEQRKEGLMRRDKSKEANLK